MRPRLPFTRPHWSRRLLCGLGFLAILPLARIAALAPPLLAQVPGDVVELKDEEVTAERLTEILAPRGGTRGLYAAPKTPHCDVVRQRVRRGAKTRGITPSAAIRIDFDFNSAEIVPEAEQRLAVMGKALGSERLASSCILIAGHTDARGSNAVNDRLSQRRAEAVVRYLVSHFQLDGQRLMAVGRGKREPIADNGTDEGRQRNRRVEIGNLGSGDES
jgi:outer membrane protein OmpA-like peptidoglycan-associated protein